MCVGVQRGGSRRSAIWRSLRCQLPSASRLRYNRLRADADPIGFARWSGAAVDTGCGPAQRGCQNLTRCLLGMHTTPHRGGSSRAYYAIANAVGIRKLPALVPRPDCLDRGRCARTACQVNNILAVFIISASAGSRPKGKVRA